jgi:hypothetical protein
LLPGLRAFEHQAVRGLFGHRTVPQPVALNMPSQSFGPARLVLITVTMRLASLVAALLRSIDLG